MTTPPLVRGYLDDLRDVATEALGQARSAELVDDITEHIEAAIATGQEPEDILQRLGSPREIVAAEAPTASHRDGPRLRVREVIAIILLLVGAAAYAVGWIVGLVLLLTSNRWSTRDKLIGALVWPGGLGLFLAVGLAGASVTSQTCDGTGSCSQVTTSGTSLPPWAGIILALVLLVPPIWTSIHLARTAKVPPTP